VCGSLCGLDPARFVGMEVGEALEVPPFGAARGGQYGQGRLCPTPGRGMRVEESASGRVDAHHDETDAFDDPSELSPSLIPLSSTAER
jgi:hypothetical protein